MRKAVYNGFPLFYFEEIEKNGRNNLSVIAIYGYSISITYRIAIFYMLLCDELISEPPYLFLLIMGLGDEL
jgi:hypothetical protein